MTARKESGFTAVECDVFGFGAPELGARLAEQRRFPPPICEAIRCHDDPAAAHRAIARRRAPLRPLLAAEMGRGLVPFAHPEWPRKRAAGVFGRSPLNLAELMAEVDEGATGFAIAA